MIFGTIQGICLLFMFTINLSNQDKIYLFRCLQKCMKIDFGILYKM